MAHRWARSGFRRQRLECWFLREMRAERSRESERIGLERVVWSAVVASVKLVLPNSTLKLAGIRVLKWLRAAVVKYHGRGLVGCWVAVVCWARSLTFGR